MKSIQYKQFFRVAILFTLILFLLASCGDKQKEKREAIINAYTPIVANCDASSTKNIESALGLIKSFLIDYKDSKYTSEILAYKNELYNCLDVHKLKEYIAKYEELSGSTYIDADSAINDQKRFIEGFDNEYGMHLIKDVPQINTILNDVHNIAGEFESMKSFFNKSFPDLLTFNSEAQLKSIEFENSKYETVHLSWKEIVNDYRNKQVQKDLDQMAAKFEEYLKKDAENFSAYVSFPKNSTV